MPAYMMFSLNGAGRICGSMILYRETDADALQAAAALIEPGRMAEVWLYRRMIGTVGRRA